MKRTRSLMINDETIINWENVNYCSLRIENLIYNYNHLEIKIGIKLIMVINFKDKKNEEINIISRKIKVPIDEVEKTLAYKQRLKSGSKNGNYSLFFVSKQEVQPIVDAYKKEESSFNIIIEKEKKKMLEIIQNMSSENFHY